MIHVIASLRIIPGKNEALAQIYRDFVPIVLKEDGCIQYQPTIDLGTDLKNQDCDTNLISVVETWESKEAFLAHIQQPHTYEFRERIKGVVEEVRVKVLQPVGGTEPSR